MNNLAEKTVDELSAMILDRGRWITKIRQNMQYADHGAFGQCFDNIRLYEREIAKIQWVLSEKLQIF